MDRLRYAAMRAAVWVAHLRASPLPDDPGEASANRRESERGQGLAEYALILALIAIIVIAALALFGTNLSGILSTIGGRVGDVAAGTP